MALFFIAMSSTALLPIYFQNILLMGATASSLLMLPRTIFNTLLTPMAGRLYDHRGIKVLLVVGLPLEIFSNFLMTFVRMDTSPLFVVILYAMYCAGMGAFYMPLIVWGCSKIPGETIAHGTALLNTMRSMSGSLGMVITTRVMSIATSYSLKTVSSPELFGMNMAFLVLIAVALAFLVE